MAVPQRRQKRTRTDVRASCIISKGKIEIDWGSERVIPSPLIGLFMIVLKGSMPRGQPKKKTTTKSKSSSAKKKSAAKKKKGGK